MRKKVKIIETDSTLLVIRLYGLIEMGRHWSKYEHFQL